MVSETIKGENTISYIKMAENHRCRSERLGGKADENPMGFLYR